MGKSTYSVFVLAASLLVWGGSGSSTSAQVQAPSMSSPAVAPADETPAAQQPVPTTALDTIIVTASKFEEPLSQVSNAVTVVTQEDIARRQTTDLFEQLREVPGFSFNQTGSRGATVLPFYAGR